MEKTSVFRRKINVCYIFPIGVSLSNISSSIVLSIIKILFAYYKWAHFFSRCSLIVKTFIDKNYYHLIILPKESFLGRYYENISVP